MYRYLERLRRTWDHIYIRILADRTVADLYRKRLGVKIGDNYRNLEQQLNLFGTKAYLISIGNNVSLSSDVRLITHDGGVGIFRKEAPGLKLFGRIDFGVNAFMLAGVTNSIKSVVGTDSEVARSVDEGAVLSSIPAGVLCSIEDYKEKELRDGVYILSTHKKERDAVINRKMSTINS